MKPENNSDFDGAWTRASQILVGRYYHLSYEATFPGPFSAISLITVYLRESIRHHAVDILWSNNTLFHWNNNLK